MKRSFKITVLTATCRKIMVEQIKALKEQTFKDFEWVIVDDLYHQKIESQDFELHSFPPAKITSYPSIASAQNDGLVHSRGELIYFMNDYVLPHPDCLRRHWELYQKYKNIMLSGKGLQVSISPDKLDKNWGEYAACDYRMDLFKHGWFRMEQIEVNLYEAFRDGIQNWWAGRNDSAPLEALLDCNGFDERFDGRWGGQDADMAQRLMTYGLRYLLDMESLCLEFDHPHGVKPPIRSEKEQQSFQETIINRKARDGIYTSGIERNLKKERENICKVLE